MEGRLHDILRNIRLLYPRGHLLPDPVRKAMLYLFHNRWRMRYHLFREAGYPIGSGHRRIGLQTCRPAAP